MELGRIKETVQQAAEAITAALDIETEIVDSNLMIIGGTGRYLDKVGSYEEEGDLDSPYLYGYLLKTCSHYICLEPANDPLYDPRERELAEICCPIVIEGRAAGLIGLVAFTAEQKEKVAEKQETLLAFLKIMAELIASRLLVELHNRSLRQRLNSALDMSAASGSFDSIIGSSSVMARLKQRALQISSSDSTVLITGESGTGKELFARAIHTSSPRNKRPFVSINCGAIPEMLLESELFGYEKGAFTGADRNGKIGKFELADGGTIFLDEIGDMPIHLQVKLLRVLQTRQIDKIGGQSPISIDVRIIAATNQNLEAMITENQFREDLYFRLSVIPLQIPALRERPEDIPLLIDHAFCKFRDKLGKNIKSISHDAYQCLAAYPWPGNVRELENALEYAINMETSQAIQMENLPDKIRKLHTNTDSAIDFKKQSADYQKQLIIRCLEETGWSVKGKREAAKKLGISESTLYRRLRL